MRSIIKVFAQHRDYRAGSEVLIAAVDPDTDRITGITAPLVLNAFEDDYATVPPPTISGPMGTQFLQAALEAAWDMGLRPKNWRVETTEQVAAMNNHLQDMRAIVFAKPVPLIDPLKPTGKDTSNVR